MRMSLSSSAWAINPASSRCSSHVLGPVFSSTDPLSRSELSASKKTVRRISDLRSLENAQFVPPPLRLHVEVEWRARFEEAHLDFPVWLRLRGQSGEDAGMLLHRRAESELGNGSRLSADGAQVEDRVVWDFEEGLRLTGEARFPRWSIRFPAVGVEGVVGDRGHPRDYPPCMRRRHHRPHQAEPRRDEPRCISWYGDLLPMRVSPCLAILPRPERGVHGKSARRGIASGVVEDAGDAPEFGQELAGDRRVGVERIAERPAIRLPEGVVALPADRRHSEELATGEEPQSEGQDVATGLLIGRQRPPEGGNVPCRFVVKADTRGIDGRAHGVADVVRVHFLQPNHVDVGDWWERGQGVESHEGRPFVGPSSSDRPDAVPGLAERRKSEEAGR